MVSAIPTVLSWLRYLWPIPALGPQKCSRQARAAQQLGLHESIPGCGKGHCRDGGLAVVAPTKLVLLT